MNQFVWRPGEGIDSTALSCIRAHFKRPKQPMVPYLEAELAPPLKASMSAAARPLALLALLIVAVGSQAQQEKALVTGKPLLDASGAVDLFKVSEAVEARDAKYGFRALSDPERVFLCVWNLEAEVNNGGFSQFFDNSAGDHAAETPRALKTIGAAGMADLVERAMAVFGAAGPPADREKRLKAMETLPESAQERWEELDAAFFELPSPEAELRAFVEAHRSEFYAPE